MFFVNTKICNGCGNCLEVCPSDAIKLDHNLAFIDQDICQGCAACMDACPQGAILEQEPVLIESQVADLVPVVDTAISVAPDQPRSLSWREAVISTLLWTGREIAPRLANLAVDFLEGRVQSTPTNQSRQNISVSGRPSGPRNGTGQRRRQRRRQRQVR